jgi:hypothetical protein
MDMPGVCRHVELAHAVAERGAVLRFERGVERRELRL